MQLVPYYSPRPFWWDIDIIKNTQCITSNVFLERFSAPLPYVCGANLPLRLLSCIKAYREKEYQKIAFDVAAFSALFFPGGIQTAVAIDCLSEVANAYMTAKKTSSKEENQPQFKTRWPNPNLVKNICCIAINTFASVYRMPPLGILALNFPMRMRNFSVTYPSMEEHCWKWVLDISVLAILLTPHTSQEVTAAVVVCIAMDCISQAIGMYKKEEDGSKSTQNNKDISKEEIKRHIIKNRGIMIGGRIISCEGVFRDCTIRENALGVLGLTEATARSLTVVEKRYRRLREVFVNRMQGKRPSGKRMVWRRGDDPISILVEMHIKNCDIAYRTISEGFRLDEGSTREEFREREDQTI